jgi:Xaa-Pro aminopeptidase
MTQNEELEIKLGRIRNVMREKKLDAIYLKRQDNFAWLSCGGKNYVGLGETGNCGLLVTADSRCGITNNIEAPRMIDEERLEKMGFTLHAGVWHDRDFESETIGKIAGKGAALGFDHASPLGVNLASDIQRLRFSLTEAELDRYRETGRLVTLALEETAASIRAGESEFEIIGRLSENLSSRGLVLYSAMCAADDRITSYRHAIATERRVKERAQLGGNFGKYGLVACLTRYVNFAPVSAELRRQMRLNQEIDLVFMENSVPGRTYQSPFLAGKEAYAARGYAAEFDKHHQGGPIGYAPRDYRVDFSHNGLIQENQGFCWNPSITGTKSEDTIVAKTGGFEFITGPVIFPRAELNINGKAYTRADILEK